MLSTGKQTSPSLNSIYSHIRMRTSNSSISWSVGDSAIPRIIDISKPAPNDARLFSVVFNRLHVTLQPASHQAVGRRKELGYRHDIIQIQDTKIAGPFKTVKASFKCITRINNVGYTAIPVTFEWEWCDGKVTRPTDRPTERDVERD